MTRTFVRSAAWSGGARWCAQALSWGSTIVVARILAPEDYGLVAMAAVVTGFVSVLSELGIAVTVVTLRDLSPVHIAQLHGLSVLTGIASFVAVAAFAPLVAAFYARPAVTPVLVALGVALVIGAMRTVPSALLQKALRFRRIAAIEAAQACVGAAVAMITAWWGWRHWALVASVLAGATAGTALTVYACRVPLAWPRRRSLRGALSFTRDQLAGTVAWYGYSNADFAVAGLMLGANPLGAYAMAWTLARAVPE